MKYLKPDEGLKVFDIRFDVTTAGPSPNGNKRIELFLLGCRKAASGHLVVHIIVKVALIKHYGMQTKQNFQEIQLKQLNGLQKELLKMKDI